MEYKVNVIALYLNGNKTAKYGDIIDHTQLPKPEDHIKMACTKDNLKNYLMPLDGVKPVKAAPVNIDNSNGLIDLTKAQLWNMIEEKGIEGVAFVDKKEVYIAAILEHNAG